MNTNRTLFGFLTAPFRKRKIGLFKEAELLDDGKLLRLAGADIEKAHDLQDEDDDGTHAERKPSEKRDDAEKGGEDEADIKLECLLYIEGNIL